LLIFEATEHWDNSGLRTTLGRAFDHGLMRTTSNRILDMKPLDPVDALRQVKSAERIFLTLPAIKTEQIVQEYLTLLLVKKR
jgi:hypothetical protein